MAEMVTFNEETILAQGKAIYSRRAEIEAMADAVTEKGFSGILISSSGGSQAMLAPFSAMIDELSDIPWRSVLSAELVLTGCNMVDEKTLVLMTSKSGDTTETLAAARWLKERGCTIFSVIGKADSPLEEVSDFSFVYGDGRPQELIVYLFLGRLLHNAGCFDAYPTFADELANLVPGLVSVRKQFDARARAYCERYHDAPYHFGSLPATSGPPATPMPCACSRKASGFAPRASRAPSSFMARSNSSRRTCRSRCSWAKVPRAPWIFA